MEHQFTEKIKQILTKNFGKVSEDIFNNNLMIKYINLKTKSANRGSKSRGSFANLYAIYVIIEDYLENGFDHKNTYAKYEGASYSKLFTRQRQLPFGNALQNHALNNRMNAEFQKFFPNTEYIPIIRNLETKKYWINENLLKYKEYHLAKSIIEIIDEYIKTKQYSFKQFIQSIEELQKLKDNPSQAIDFIMSLLAPNIDARLFEIVSFSILKYYYSSQEIIWGYEEESLVREYLKLYKTGRTNANDGGIDFVMKPLGRFFQVTETLDFKKYFLDIDKIQKYPITFIIKTEENIDEIYNKIKNNAKKIYVVDIIVEAYMRSIEEIINIPILKERLLENIDNRYLDNILNEIIIQSKVEFNYIEIPNEPKNFCRKETNF